MKVWSHVVPIVLFATNVQAFAPAPIRWGGATDNHFWFVSVSRAFPTMNLQPPELKIVDISDKASLNSIPHFTAKPDNTISWDAKGLCIEASGAQRGNTARLNFCSGAFDQKWDWLPW